MKKRIISICTIVLMFVCLFGGMPQEVSAETDSINSVRESVVVVSCDREFSDIIDDENHTIGTGTGFFVDNEESNVQYLVTNYHVVKYFVEYGRGEWQESAYDEDKAQYQYVGEDEGKGKGKGVPLHIKNGEVLTVANGKMRLRVFYDSENYDEAYVVDSDEVKDIALLKLDAPTEKRKALTLCSPTEDMVGSTVYAVGYPGLSDNWIVDATSKWGPEDATVTKGVISRLLTKSGSGVRSIQTDAVIQHGNSGGPMINENGNVLGVNTFSVSSQTENNNYAVNIDEVISMLKSNAVEVKLSSDQEVINSEVEENSEQGVVPEPSVEEDTSQAKGEGKTDDVLNDDSASGLSGTNLTIVISVAAVAVLLIIVVILLSRKKKTSPAERAEGNRGGKPVVRSLSSQHNGAGFPLNGRQIIIGRNKASCTVVFGEKTPGVSSRHCSLSYDKSSGDFILTDLSSTYGTFLANGQKLVPQTPYHLHSGEQFYLGGDANMLRVEIE